MEFSMGSVVCAAAGREKGGLYLVIGVEGEYLLLADGKRRKVQSPKRKKRKHVAPTGLAPETILAQGGMITNTQARKALAKYRLQFEGGFFFGEG